MALVQHTQSYLFSSDPANGALNRSPDGSTFSVQLDSPIQVPRNAVNATIEVTSAEIWWTIPNISARLGNNLLYLYSEAPAGVPVTATITIQDGLYSVEGLAASISTELATLGLPTNLISLGGDDATQKAIITYNNGGFRTYLDFTQPNTFRGILGFDSRVSPALADQSTDGYPDFGDSVAEFNTISSFLINSDLVSAGIPLNSINGGVLSKVDIGSTPTGRLITFRPYIPSVVSASELIGSGKNAFSFRLTDQRRNLVDTNSEYYSFELHLKWYIPHTQSNAGMHSGTHR